MKLPTQHVCRAAIRVIGMVDQARETVESLRWAYRNHPSDGTFGAEEFDRGREVLERAGLLAVRDDRLYVSDEGRRIARLPEDDAALMVVETLLLRESPAWVVAVAWSGARWEYMPDGVEERLTDVCPDPLRREEFLMSVAKKVSLEELQEIGMAGERHVVRICREYLIRHGRPDLADRVARVSQVSDQLGYDVVAPDLSGVPVRMEVKTQSGGPEPARVFLSRNEAEQGSRDDRWALIVCDRFANGTVQERGWCTYDVVAKGLPRDARAEPAGKWMSVQLLLDRALLIQGLPLGGGGLAVEAG